MQFAYELHRIVFSCVYLFKMFSYVWICSMFCFVLTIQSFHDTLYKVHGTYTHTCIVLFSECQIYSTTLLQASFGIPFICMVQSLGADKKNLVWSLLCFSLKALQSFLSFICTGIDNWCASTINIELSHFITTRWLILVCHFSSRWQCWLSRWGVLYSSIWKLPKDSRKL